MFVVGIVALVTVVAVTVGFAWSGILTILGGVLVGVLLDGVACEVTVEPASAPGRAERVCRRLVLAYAPRMRRTALVLGSMLPLAACRSPAPAEPPSPPACSGEDALAGERAPAFDVDGFEPPFGRLPLHEGFARAHGLRRVVMHTDTDTEDARLVDAEVVTFDYDREGRLLATSTRLRGEPYEEVRYEHVDGRLVMQARSRADGTQHVTRYHYDAAGRVQRIEHGFPFLAFEEHHTYDAHGRPSTVTRSEDDRRTERCFTYDGDRLERVVSRLPEGGEIVTEHFYDAPGRPTRRVTRGVEGRVDVYDLAWDPRGRLRALSFTENERPIYRRTYAYDEDGRPIREELHSFVSAMGRGNVVRYEYERHGEPPREVATTKPAELGKAELVAATVATFDGAYEELATVTYQSVGEGRFMPDSVTIYVPEAIVAPQSADELRQQACAAKQALGRGCDCEHVTLGEPIDHALVSWPDKRVVPLTLHLMLAC